MKLFVNYIRSLDLMDIHNSKGEQVYQIEGDGDLKAYNYDPTGQPKEVAPRLETRFNLLGEEISKKKRIIYEIEFFYVRINQRRSL